MSDEAVSAILSLRDGDGLNEREATKSEAFGCLISTPSSLVPTTPSPSPVPLFTASSFHHVPSRIKLTRDPVKRTVQNRMAQRAYRERREFRLQQLQNHVHEARATASLWHDYAQSLAKAVNILSQSRQSLVDINKQLGKALKGNNDDSNFLKDSENILDALLTQNVKDALTAVNDTPRLIWKASDEIG